MAKRKTGAVILVLGLLLTMTIDSSQVVAQRAPTLLRVGLSTVETVCDFTAVAGSYRLLVDNGANEVSPIEEGSWFRASFDQTQGGIQLCQMGKDYIWSIIGTCQQVSLVPCGSAETSMFKVNGKTYRGALRIKVNSYGTALTVINEVPVEAYLYGVVPREMSNSWPLEALKAQAVAARTYAVKNVNKHGIEGFDVCSKSHCQVYGGVEAEGEPSRQAVDATRGQVLVDGSGNLIYALYHSNSGGFTEDNVNVNGYPFSYLKGKEDPYSLGYGLWQWSYVTSVVADGSGNSVEEKLKSRYPYIGTIASFSTAKYVSGRVYEVVVTDENGQEIRMSGAEFGKMFNPGFNTKINKESFMSSKFDIKTDAEVYVLNGLGQKMEWEGGLKSKMVRNTGNIMSFGSGDFYQVRSQYGDKSYPKSPKNVTFNGQGWGHGVGMSQWGAYGMAIQGKSYREILEFYYEGAVLSRLEQ